MRDQNPDLRECLNPNCDYFFFEEECKGSNQTYHFCPKCKVEYCLKCKIVYHVEQTCEEVEKAKKAKAESELKAKVDRINNTQLPEDF